MKLTEKKKEDQHLLKRLTGFIETHFWRIVIILAAISVLAPVAVWLCYGAEKTVIITEISADGMLGYIGSIIGGVVSMMVAIIALYQAEKIHERDEEKAFNDRLVEIRPNLYLEMDKINDSFEVRISNGGMYRAIGVYMFAYDFAPLVEPGKRVKRRVEFRDESEKGYLTIDSSYYDVSEDGYPKRVELCFLDIDRNLYIQEFRLVEGNQYDPGLPIIEDFGST